MSKIQRAIAVGGLLIATSTSVPHAWSQGAPNWPPPASNVMPAPAPTPLPQVSSNIAKFDAMLAKKQYSQLGQELRRTQGPSALAESMSWQQAKLVGGGSAFFGFFYAADLWRLGELVSGDKGQEIKKTAIFSLLYAYQLIEIDGVKCQDASAPAHRRDQLYSTFPHIWGHVSKLSDEERAGLVDLALGVESRTAPNRQDDDFLCLDGVDQLHAAIEKNGSASKEGKSVPGLPGRTFDVAPDPDYKAKFVSKDVWLPKQTAIRAAMPDNVRKVMERFKTPTDQKAPNAPR